ncbi:B12-binding domain-containing radical SAM protein [Acidobacteriota bacterium]
MKIMLIKPPRNSLPECSLEKSESLALGYLTASLRGKGHTVSIINGALRSLAISEIAYRVIKDSIDFVGINLADPTLVNSTKELVQEIRRRAFIGHISIGGHTATFHWKDILTKVPEIDSVVLFEGEETICDLVDALKQGKEWQTIPGLAYANNDKPIRSGNRSFIDDLGRLAYPARDDLQYVLSRHGAYNVPILSSRGCHFNCSFCSIRSFFKRNGRPYWRRRSVNNVLEEIDKINSEYAVNDYLFLDDLFLDSSSQAKNYAKEFAKEILCRGIQISFTVSATVDGIDGEILTLMHKAGLRKVFVGAESASPEILRKLNKWFTPDQINTAVEILRDLDIEFSLSWMNFTPFSRFHNLRENLSFFNKFEVDLLPSLVNRYQAYGGSPLFLHLQTNGMLKGDFPHYDYSFEDSKVDLAYRICKATFKPFLTLTQSLGKISHHLRLLDFRSATKSNDFLSEIQNRNSPTKVFSNRIAFNNIRKGINKDVAFFFRKLLDLVELQDGSCTMSTLSSSIEELRSQVISSSEGWLKTLRFYTIFCTSPQFPSLTQEI